MEFYGVPEKNSIHGIFVDNPSETFMDIGYLNSNRYLFGSMFDDLDYYIFLGDNCGNTTLGETATQTSPLPDKEPAFRISGNRHHRWRRLSNR